MKLLTILLLLTCMITGCDRPIEKCDSDNCYRNGFKIDANGEYQNDNY